MKVLLLLLISFASFSQITVRDAVGTNGQIQEDDPNLSFRGMFDDEGAPARTKAVLLRRLYMDQFIFGYNDVGSAGKLKLSTTHQGFRVSEKIDSMQAKGASVIWCTQGAFKYQTIYTASPPDGAPLWGGSENVKLLIPLNVEDDPYDAATYSKTVEYVKNVALIYGRTPYAGGLDTDEVYTYSGGTGTYLTGGSLNNGTGLGGVDVIEIQNECFIGSYFFEWGDPGDRAGEVVMDYRSYAILFKACYDAIKAADPTMRVKVGGFWDDGQLTDYNGIQDAYFTEFGTYLPSDVILGFHNYPYDDAGGVIPETTASECHSWYQGERGLLATNKVWDNLGYDWQICEFGWDESINSDRSTPQITGFTREESLAILDVRMMLLGLTAQNCTGMIHYRLVDQSTSPSTSSLRFASMGWYYKNYSYLDPDTPALKKPNAVFIEELVEEMGECELPLQLVKGGTDGDSYRVVGRKGSQIVIAEWTKDSEVTYTTY